MRAFTCALLLALLAAAIHAVPLPLEGDVVSLVEEDGSWSDLNFRALEETGDDQNDEEATSAIKGLGEGGIFSPPRVKNEYAKMAANMEGMKKSYKKLRKRNRMYHKLKMYSVSEEESAAAAKVIAANQVLATERKPSKASNAAVETANLVLAKAEARRSVAEQVGSKMFGVHPAVADKPSRKSGPFGRLYAMSAQLRKDENDARKVRSASNVKTSKSLLKKLYPGKKGKKKLRKLAKQDDIYYKYDISKTDFDATHSQHFKKAHQRVKVEEEKRRLLHQAAKRFITMREENPKLRYQDMVKGTKLEGIENVFVADMEKQAADLKNQADSMGTGELKLAKDHEKYIQKNEPLARVLSMKQFSRREGIDRAVTKQVPDPEGIKPAVVKADAAKLRQQRNHPSIKQDLAALKTAKKIDNKLMAQQSSKIQALKPDKKAISSLAAEGVLGVKQLEEDQKVANRRLKRRLYRVQKKKFVAGKNPNWARIEATTNRRQKRALSKIAQKAVVRDAKRLAKHGSRTDMKILKADTKAALKGGLIISPAEKALLAQQQAFYNKARRDPKIGKEGLDDIKTGIKNKIARDQKRWDETKKAAMTQGGVGPAYGAAALRALPSGSQDPLMNGDLSKVNYSGNTGMAAVPLRKADPPTTGAISQKAVLNEKTAAHTMGDNKRPRVGFRPKH